MCPARLSLCLWGGGVGFFLLLWSDYDAIRDHQTDPNAQENIRDVEDVGEDFAYRPRVAAQLPRARPLPPGEGVDHVSDVAEDDAVVHIAQDASEEHTEDE